LLFRGQTHRDFVRNRLGYFVFDIKNIFHRIVNPVWLWSFT
jgi:hypothetical protein